MSPVQVTSASTRWRARLLLLLGSVLVALACVEVGLRWAGPRLFQDTFVVRDPVLGWALRPNFSGWETEENTLWVRTNSAGFNDEERSVEKTPGKVRVALIGDSYVHSYYVPRDRSYAAFLERDLSHCLPTPGGIEVLSFGVTQYATAQELLLYQSRVAAYAPDLVLLSFFTKNDIVDNNRDLSHEDAPFFYRKDGKLELDTSFRRLLPAPPRSPPRPPPLESLTDHSRTVLFLNQRLAGILTQGVSTENRERPMPDDELERATYAPPARAEVAEAWSITEALLSEFNRQVAANGGEFWLVTLANDKQVDPNPDRRTAYARSLGVDDLFYPDRRLAAFARAHDIHAVSLAEPLASYAASTGTYLNGGVNMALGVGHWNETGNRMAAALTAEAVCAGSAALAGPRPHD